MSIEGFDDDGKDNHADHKFIGQTYPYHKNVMAPDSLGMSPEGDFNALIKNVAGLVNYGQLLITGDGHANAKVNREGRDEALGDKFFLKTMGTCYPVQIGDNGKPKTALYRSGGGPERPELRQCGERKDELAEGQKCDFIYYKAPPKDDGEEDEAYKTRLENDSILNKKNEWKGTGTRIKRKRYVYIDNLPTGQIPGLGALHGMRGLIPSMIENLGHFNPVKLIDSVSAPAIPGCVKINMETIKFNDNGDQPDNWHHEYNRDTHFVAVSDVADIYPCSFSKDNINPVTGKTINGCPPHPSQEGFGNLFSNQNEKNTMLNLKNKPIAKLFNASFGVLLAYLLWRVLRKEMKM
jgi:hypothetical protein